MPENQDTPMNEETSLSLDNGDSNNAEMETDEPNTQNTESPRQDVELHESTARSTEATVRTPERPPAQRRSGEEIDLQLPGEQ